MPESSPLPRILCVDDEAAVLQALRRNLHGTFDVHIAHSGLEGLSLIEAGQDFAVVVSDMRMPGMNGATFLSEVRLRLPAATRMLLTGQADIPAAVAAINDGQVFRFLTKPCSKDRLLLALTDAVKQHDLLQSEQVLLNQTLRGSLGVLVEALGFANPDAMTPVLRQRALVRELSNALGIKPSWDIEIAAMFSHLCTLSLPKGLLDRFRRGYPLPAEEQLLVRHSNVVAQRLVSQVPRLEPVRDLLRQAGKLEREEDADVSIGARVLLATLDYCGLLAAGLESRDALGTLAGRERKYGPDLLARLAILRSVEALVVIRAVPFTELRVGMTLIDPLRTHQHLVITAPETDITPSLLEQLHAFAARNELVEPMLVRYKPG
jgi:CheY-like chemotaxis protein